MLGVLFKHFHASKKIIKRLTKKAMVMLFMFVTILLHLVGTKCLDNFTSWLVCAQQRLKLFVLD